jgi:indolepyruvate ferredoxin oxidoreductase beta subunit
MSELILCGRGGQGIVFLTRQVGQIITDSGGDVISSETHGMAVRGGSINSHLRIGKFFSPLVQFGRADFLVSLDSSETQNNIHYLKHNGMVLENSPLSDEVNVKRVDATAIARSLGFTRLENVVMLGFASTVEGFPVGPEILRAHFLKETRERVRTLNVAALEAGIEKAVEG